MISGESMNTNKSIKILSAILAALVLTTCVLIVRMRLKSRPPRPVEETTSATTAVTQPIVTYATLIDLTETETEPETETEELTEETTTERETDPPTVKATTAAKTASPTTRKLSTTASKRIVSISVTKSPDKTTYYFGDSLSFGGMKVTGEYSNGDTVTISNSSLYYDAPSMDTAGSKRVTVYYIEPSTQQRVETTFSITVKKPELRIRPTELEISVGEKYTMRATTVPSGQSVTWQSGSKNIVSINSSGVVEGKSAGTATITARFTYNGRTYYADEECEVTVSKLKSSIAIQDADWSDGRLDSSAGKLSLRVLGTVKSNYDLTLVTIRLRGPADVNGSRTTFTQRYSFDEDEIDGKEFDLDQKRYSFDVIEGEKYELIIYAEDASGETATESFTITAKVNSSDETTRKALTTSPSTTARSTTTKPYYN